MADAPRRVDTDAMRVDRNRLFDYVNRLDELVEEIDEREMSGDSISEQMDAAQEVAKTIYVLLRGYEIMWGRGGPPPIGILNANDIEEES